MTIDIVGLGLILTKGQAIDAGSLWQKAYDAVHAARPSLNGQLSLNILSALNPKTQVIEIRVHSNEPEDVQMVKIAFQKNGLGTIAKRQTSFRQVRSHRIHA